MQVPCETYWYVDIRVVRCAVLSLSLVTEAVAVLIGSGHESRLSRHSIHERTSGYLSYGIILVACAILV